MSQWRMAPWKREETHWSICDVLGICDQCTIVTWGVGPKLCYPLGMRPKKQSFCPTPIVTIVHWWQILSTSQILQCVSSLFQGVLAASQMAPYSQCIALLLSGALLAPDWVRVPTCCISESIWLLLWLILPTDFLSNLCVFDCSLMIDMTELHKEQKVDEVNPPADPIHFFIIFFMWLKEEKYNENRTRGLSSVLHSDSDFALL